LNEIASVIGIKRSTQKQYSGMNTLTFAHNSSYRSSSCNTICDKYWFSHFSHFNSCL